MNKSVYSFKEQVTDSFQHKCLSVVYSFNAPSHEFSTCIKLCLLNLFVSFITVVWRCFPLWKEWLLTSEAFDLKVAFLRQLAVGSFPFFLFFFFPIRHASTLVVFSILHRAEIVWKTIGLFLIWCFRKLGKIEIRLYSKVEKEHVNSNNWNLWLNN